MAAELSSVRKVIEDYGFCADYCVYCNKDTIFYWNGTEQTCVECAT